MRSFSGSITNMPFTEQVLDNPWLLLSPMQMAAHDAHELRLVPGPTLSHRIGLDILVEQLIRVEFRAIAGQQDQSQVLPLLDHELFR